MQQVPLRQFSCLIFTFLSWEFSLSVFKTQPYNQNVLLNFAYQHLGGGSKIPGQLYRWKEVLQGIFNSPLLFYFWSWHTLIKATIFIWVEGKEKMIDKHFSGAGTSVLLQEKMWTSRLPS